MSLAPTNETISGHGGNLKVKKHHVAIYLKDPLGKKKIFILVTYFHAQVVFDYYAL